MPLHKEYRYPHYQFNNNEHGIAPTFVREGLDFFTKHDALFQAGSMDKRFNIPSENKILDTQRLHVVSVQYLVH